MEKHGYNGYFGGVCVDWFVNEMLKKETYVKNYFEDEIDMKPERTPKIDGRSSSDVHSAIEKTAVGYKKKKLKLKTKNKLQVLKIFVNH